MATYPQAQKDAYKVRETDIEDISLQEICKSYLCGKAQGKISECAKCTTQCSYGKRGLDLLNGSVNSASKSVYTSVPEGKTLLDMARQEAKARRNGEYIPKPEDYVVDDWYLQAYKSGNAMKWLMENLSLTKSNARARVYTYWQKHPGLREAMPLWKTRKRKSDIPIVVEQTVEPVVSEEPDLISALRKQISDMTKLRNEYKQRTDEYLQKADEYMNLHNKMSDKVDILQKALDALME